MQFSFQNKRGFMNRQRKRCYMGFDEKEPLDEIIEKINEKFKGNFTEGDKVPSKFRDKLMKR